MSEEVWRNFGAVGCSAMARSLCRSVRLFVHGIRLFCIAPYRLGPDGSVEKSKGLVYLCWITLVLANLSNVLFYGVQARPPNLQTDPYIFLGYLRCCFVCSCLLLSGLHLMQRFEAMARVIREVLTLRHHLPMTPRQLRTLLVLVPAELVLLHFVHAAMFYEMYTSKMTQDVRRLFVALSVTESAGIIICAEMLFLNIIALLTVYMHLLHCELEKTVQADRDVKHITVIKTIDVLHKTARPTHERIRQLRLLHGQLFDLKEQVNEVYSWPLVFASLRIFTESVFFVFLNIVRVQVGLDNISTKINVTISIWVPMMLTKLFVMTSVCDGLTSAMRRTGLILARLRSATANKNTKEELETFSHEFQNMNPAITAFSFFKVDLKLLHSMLSVMCMYVIILLQFQFHPQRGTNPLNSLLYYFD